MNNQYRIVLVRENSDGTITVVAANVVDGQPGGSWVLPATEAVNAYIGRLVDETVNYAP